MINYESAEKKKELIWTKYQLSSLSVEDFLKLCSSKEEYINLLFQLETIMVLDCDYILLGNHMEKYQRIINYGKHQFKTKGNIRSYENETIEALNIMEPTKEEYRRKYLEDHLRLRCQMKNRILKSYFQNSPIEQIDSLIRTLTEFDYSYFATMNYLIQGLEVRIQVAPHNFLSSISYCLRETKEIYEEEKEYVDATLSILNTFEEQNLIPIEYKVKAMKKTLNEIKGKNKK